jgi:hypothetical protein
MMPRSPRCLRLRVADAVHRPEELVQVERLAHQGVRPQAVGHIGSLRCARDDQQRHMSPAGVVSHLPDEAVANNLGALRSLGLIDYPRRGQVVPTDLLFPSCPGRRAAGPGLRYGGPVRGQLAGWEQGFFILGSGSVGSRMRGIGPPR